MRRKIPFAHVLLGVVFLWAAVSFFPGPSCANTHVPDNLAGFLVFLTKTPPELRLRTGSGEKRFPWNEETKFLDAQGKAMSATDFYKKLKDRGVLLFFEKGTLTQVQPAEF